MADLTTQILEAVEALSAEITRLHERLDSIERSNGQPSPEDRLLGVREVAKRLDCGPSTIYKGVAPKAKTKFPIPFKRIRGRVKFLSSDVQAHLARMKDET